MDTLWEKDKRIFKQCDVRTMHGAGLGVGSQYFFGETLQPWGNDVDSRKGRARAAVRVSRSPFLQPSE